MEKALRIAYEILNTTVVKYFTAYSLFSLEQGSKATCFVPDAEFLQLVSTVIDTDIVDDVCKVHGHSYGQDSEDDEPSAAVGEGSEALDHAGRSEYLG